MTLLITGSANFDEEMLTNLQNKGHKIIFLQDESKTALLSVDEIEGVVCNNLFSYINLDLFKKLKFVQFTCAGEDRLPIKTLQAKKISYFTAGSIYSIPISEFIICCLLDILKESHTFFVNQTMRKWQKNRELKELFGLKCLFFGCGNIAHETAKRLKALGCVVYGIDNKKAVDEYFDKIYGINDIETVLRDADIVISTLPLNDETFHYFNKEKFGLMKQGSIFINCSRGKVVDENELIRSITKFYGVILDVFETEPLDSESKLWNFKNVIVTPHNSFVSNKNNLRLYQLLLKNLESES